MSTLEQLPSWPVGIAARAALVLAAAGLLTLLMRRSSASARHLVWAAAAAATLALPALSLLPGWHILPAVHAAPQRPAPPAPATQAGRAPALVPPSAATFPPPAFDLPPVRTVPLTPPAMPAPARIDFPTLVLLAWAAGAVAFLVPPVLGRILLARTARRCRPADDSWTHCLAQSCADVGVRRPVRLLLGPDRAMPMAWGMGRGATVLLPAAAADWPAARRRTVLLHELAHLRRADCLTDLLAQAARALHWFNPLAHIALWRLRVERERACDDAVLRLGARAPEYAADLLDITARLRPSHLGAAAMAIARSSKLEGRIREILDTRRNRGELRPRHILAATIAAALLAIPVAAMRPAAETTRLAVSASQPEDGASSDRLRDSTRLRQVVMAIVGYTQKHDGRFPPDLGATLPYVSDTDDAGRPLTRAQRAAIYLSTRDERTLRVPDEPTAEWINQNTSFVYLGGADLNMSQTADWHSLVLVHDAGKTADPMYTMGMLDCSATIAPRAFAEWTIARSKANLEATRTGGRFLDREQSAWDLTQIMRAIDAYAKDHAGELPPDLGATLAYIPAGPRTSTPAKRASVFLSPSAQLAVKVPERPTPQWVNEHASYSYLGGAGIRTARIADPEYTVLVHLDEGFKVMGGDGQEGINFPVGAIKGGVRFVDETYAISAAAESRKVLEAARTGGPLPDYQHAMHDLDRIVQAIRAYAKANNDALPPDLGATAAYIPAETLAADTPRERALVYLSPRAERTIQPPANPTPQWINANTSYVYLGTPDLTLSGIMNEGVQVIVHGDPAEQFDRAIPGGRWNTVPYGMPFGMVVGATAEGTAQQAAASRKQIEALRAGPKPAEADPENPLSRSMEKMRRIMIGIAVYAHRNDGRYPPDLGAVFAIIDKGDPVARARIFLSPDDEARVQIPEDPTPEWINRHASYTYLAGGLDDAAIPDSSVAVLHDRLDRAYPGRGGDPVCPVSRLDGSTLPASQERAAALVAEGRLVLDAGRKGLPFPGRFQALWDLTMIGRAIRGYADANNGELPPDLGSLLAFIPDHPTRANTPAQKAAVFLSPATKAAASIPAKPTPEWVNANASYVYLGRAGVRLSMIPNPDSTILVHGPLTERYAFPGHDGAVLPAGSAGNARFIADAARLEARIEVSRAILDALSTGRPLPDYEHALRDVELLNRAIRGYAKANDDALPPDLGATLTYLPAEIPPAERARVFLSPRAERTVRPPADPAREWINQNASYTYLGAGGVTLKQVADRGVFALIHADPAQPSREPFQFGSEPVVPYGPPLGPATGATRPSLERFTESRRQIEALRAAR